MEMVLINGFCEMTQNEMNYIDGGSITLATTLFTVLGYKVTIGVCLKAGAAIGLTAWGELVLK